jgi:hypothetical protein
MEEIGLALEVLELALASQAIDAAPDDFARLERAMEVDPRAIAWYVRVVDDTATLCEAAAGEESGAGRRQAILLATGWKPPG